MRPIVRGAFWGSQIGGWFFTFLFTINFQFGGLIFGHPLVPLEGLLFGAFVGAVTLGIDSRTTYGQDP